MNLLKISEPPILAYSARLRFRWILTTFTPILAPFRPRFWLILGSFWAPFWLFLGLFWGPLRGRVLSENTRETKRFDALGPSKRTRFRAHFRVNFEQVFDSILGSFWCTFWEAGRTPFSQSWGWPGRPLGPGLANFHQEIFN